MEDLSNSAISQISRSSDSSIELEPQRKKRCLRFPSDLSSEDPSLLADSGFGDLPSVEVPLTKEQDQHGDLEVSSFFHVGSGGQNQCEDSNHPHSSSITITNSSDLSSSSNPQSPPKASQSTLSSSSSSDPCCSSDSSSSPSSRSSSANSTRDQDQDAESDSESSPIDDNFIDVVLSTKGISSNPSRAAMMQRFLSHLRSNPNDAQLQHFLALLLSGPEFGPPRHRLRHVTTIQDAARLLRCSKKILVLTGAGISVSCGIPDFRSKDGLYSRVAKVFPELRDPQSVFDVRLFRRDPRPFFLTAKELYPGQFRPSLSHKFIRKLETRSQLLRNYSQNIDTLENICGIEKVTMCHGSFATATCIRCQNKVSADEIKEKVLSGEIPYCKVCSTMEETSLLKYPLGQQSASANNNAEEGQGQGAKPEEDEDDDIYPAVENFPLPPVVKPDIVFFGEDLPEEFHNNLQMDKPHCDLVLVIGSSLRVRPVSLIPGMVPPEVPQILINRESLPHCRFDVELLGNCDHILAQLCKMMGPDFLDLAEGPELREIDKLPRSTNSDGEISEPKSEHDIQALKACWEPKTNEKLVDRLPSDTYLNWRPRQYIFEGAEEIYDPDEDEDENDDSDSSDSSSCSSLPMEDSRIKEVDEELQLQKPQLINNNSTLNSEASLKK